MATTRASSARAAVDLAFEELYRGHRADVYRAALRELGNAHDAEDVTQAAFADAYRAVLRGTRPQSPRAWLLAISENVRRRRFRTAQRRPREQLVDDADFPPAAELPYEQSRALAEALAALPRGAAPRLRPPRDRRPLLYRDRRRGRLDRRVDPDAPLPGAPLAAGAARSADRGDPQAGLPAAGAELAGRAVLARGAREPDTACGRRARRNRARRRRRERRRPGPAGRRPRRGPYHGSSTGGCRRRAGRRACAREAHTSVGEANRGSAGRRPCRADPTPRAADAAGGDAPARIRARHGPRTDSPAGRRPRTDAERARGRGGRASRSSSRCRRSLRRRLCCRRSRCHRSPCRRSRSRSPSPFRRCRRLCPTSSPPRPARRAPLGRALRRCRFLRYLFRRCRTRLRKRRRCAQPRGARAPGEEESIRGRDPFSPCTVLPC